MIPSWISNLSDLVLKADFTSYYKADAITEAEMAKALNGLVAENNKSKARLSASQFADLQSIAANIGSMGASAYLQFITDALVNGNAANATWTGGAAKSVALGNLAVGATTKQLRELVDKWFEGADLPNNQVITPPTPTFTVKYSNVASPLFGPLGPKMSDINQGILGDCYLLASLAEVAKQNPSAITSMITKNDNGTFGVRFYVDGVARYVTVNRDLADGGTEFNQATNIWASVIETAFAEIQDQGLITGNTGTNTYNYGNSFSTIGNGGDSGYALEAITNATEITTFYGSKSSSVWYPYFYDQSLTETGHDPGVSTASLLSTIAADLLVGDDVDLNSATNARFANGKRTLIDDHVMSLIGYDASTGNVEIRNPWGVTPGGQNYDTTFKVGLSALLADGDSITADNVGKATSIKGAPVVAAQGLQNMAQVLSFSVSDSVAAIDADLSGLISDSKLTALTATGAKGADTLDLTGLAASATINMDGNAAKATLSGDRPSLGVASSLSLGSRYDSLTLGSGHATIDYAFGVLSGVEYVSNFSAIHDLLSMTLLGHTLEQTLVNGGDWISASTDLSHGVFLAGVTSAQKVTVSHGIATVV